MALDFRNEHSPDKMLKEIKKSDFKNRFVVGTATIRGKTIDIKSLEKKGNIKPRDIKQFLASGIKSTVSRAIIDGAADEENQTAEGNGSSTEQLPREQRRIELDALERELEALADEFQIA